MTATIWVPVGLVLLLAILMRPDEQPLPEWAVPSLLLGTIAGVASVVALSAGIRFLRERA